MRLYEAMLERWPKDEGLRRAAVRGIAEAWGQAGDSWRRSWWMWKFLQEFKPTGEELAEAYQEMTAGAYHATNTIPGMRDWAFGLREVLLLAEAGRIPAGHKVVDQAGANLATLLSNEERYDELAALLDRLKGLGPRYGGAYAAIGQTLQRFGHAGLAGEYFRGAGNEQAFAALLPLQQGAVYGLPREERLESQLEALVRGQSPARDLAAGKTGAIQDLLDAAARTRATISASDYSRASSAWGALDGLLQKLSPEHRAVLAAAQQRAAGPLVGALRQTRDPQLLLIAFRRYPFSRPTCGSLGPIPSVGSWRQCRRHRNLPAPTANGSPAPGVRPRNPLASFRKSGILFLNESR